MLANGIYIGQLTIKSEIDGKSYNENINVGLYVSDQTSLDGSIALLNNQNDNYGTSIALAKDTIRPFLYVFDKTLGVMSRINVHTGEVDNPFPVIEGESFSGLVVSAEGETLIAQSDVNRSIYQFNLTDFTYTKTDYSTNLINPSRLKSIYPNGKALLLVEDSGTVVDLSSGDVLTDEQSFGSLSYSPGMAIADDQKALYGVDFGLSGSNLLGE